jgi:hypothetical protein
MSGHPSALLLSLMIVALSMGDAQGASVQYQTFRAATANDVINEMLTAGKSRRPTVIRLAPGRYIFSTRLFSSQYDASFLPVVSTTIQIIGSDPATTIFEVDENSLPHRFFTVVRGGNLAIYKVTLTGGAEECVGGADCAKLGGGAAYNAGGELDFHDCVLRQNAAFNTEGFDIGGGGAIYNLAGHFLLDRTTVTQNGAESIGGAVVLQGGKGSIWNSIIRANGVGFGVGKAAAAFAGGIFVSSGSTLYITGSTISGNGADVTEEFLKFVFGGGIYNLGTTSLINSAVTENGPTTRNPAEPDGPGSGGGIFNGGTMLIENSTIGGNTVGTLGGGIYNGGRLQLQGVTITGNSVRGANGIPGIDQGFPPGCSREAPQLCVSGGSGIWNEPQGIVTVTQSAIGANEEEDCNGVLSSKGRNAIGDSLNCKLTPSPGLGGRPTHDLVNLDLRLGELQDDGAAGNAHYPLLADSPLIDAGGSIGPTCTRLDQIGQARVEGDADHDGASVCDIGAIEYQPPPRH